MSRPRCMSTSGEHSDLPDTARYTRGTVIEDQPDYDHLPFRKKSLDEDRSAPVIFTVNFFAI